MAPEKEYAIEPNGKSVVQSVGDVVEQADALVGSIGQTVDSASQVVQETLRRTKRSARVAMKNVSEGIQNSTDYLTGKGIGGAVEDVEALIRCYPFHALLIGFSMGYLLSRSRKR
ncbi:MAG: hypothetical protein ABIO96_13760 [Nitrospiraceae bacterium]